MGSNAEQLNVQGTHGRVFIDKMIVHCRYQGHGCSLGWDYNDPHVNRIAKHQPRWIECLPGTFVDAIAERSRKCDLDDGLGARFGRIERQFFGRIQQRSANVAQTITCIPVAGSAVLDEPLFVDGGAIRYGSSIENGQVRNEGQIADAIFRVGGGSR